MPLKIPHLEQYSGPFAMEEGAFNAALEHFNRLDLGAHIAARMADDDDLDVMPDMSMTDDGICCISCVGAMTKYGSSLSDGPSTIALRQCVRRAANDPKCAGIMMRFDSPGGSADGTEELASEIAAAATKKPVWAFVDGMAASAAYWACCQCQNVVAAPGSLVGSIGTYGVMYDRAAQYTQQGVKAVVVKAGEMKGKGTPGTQITPEQIADTERVIGQINQLFIDGVAKGRKLSADGAKALNDGRVHVGANARAIGLVDDIGDYDSAMSGLRAVIAKQTKQSIPNNPRPGMSSGAKQESTIMSEAAPNTAAPANVTAQPQAVAATLKELKQTFPKSTSDWREKCQEDGLTLSAANSRWTEHLMAENTRLTDELAQAKVEKKPIGTKPVPAGEKRPGADGGDAGDPKAQLLVIAAEFQKAGMKREKAFARACKENSELHQQWLDSHAAQHAGAVKRGFASA